MSPPDEGREQDMAYDFDSMPDSTWEIDDEGTITIQPGIIRMREDGSAPWADVADRVTSIEVPVPEDPNFDFLGQDNVVVPPRDSTRLFAGMPELKGIFMPTLVLDNIRDATEMFADDPKLEYVALDDEFVPYAVEHLDGIFRNDASLRYVPEALGNAPYPYLKSAEGAVEGADHIDDSYREGGYNEFMHQHDGRECQTVGSVLVSRWGNGYALMPADGPDGVGVLPEPSRFDENGRPVWPWSGYDPDSEWRGTGGIEVMGKIVFPEDCRSMFAFCSGRDGMRLDDLENCDLTKVRDVSYIFDGYGPTYADNVDDLCKCDLPNLERCHAVLGSPLEYMSGSVDDHAWLARFDEQVAEHARECGATDVTTEPSPEDAKVEAREAAARQRQLADYDGPDDGDEGLDLEAGD